MKMIISTKMLLGKISEFDLDNDRIISVESGEKDEIIIESESGKKVSVLGIIKDRIYYQESRENINEANYKWKRLRTVLGLSLEQPMNFYVSDNGFWVEYYV